MHFSVKVKEVDPYLSLFFNWRGKNIFYTLKLFESLFFVYPHLDLLLHIPE